MSDVHEIKHIMSIARSGETLLLRCLACSPDAHITHNLLLEDTEPEKRLFEFLRQYPDQTIPHDTDVLLNAGVKRGSVIILKQGVWEHAWPFSGIVLIRNPLSVFASLRQFDQAHSSLSNDENWYRYRLPRLLVWAERMNVSLAKDISQKQSPVEQFTEFLNFRFRSLKGSDSIHPVFRYEDLCEHPGSILRDISCCLGIRFTHDMVNSHRFYTKGCVGHGFSDLSRPISPPDNSGYARILTPAEISYLFSELGWFFDQFYADFEFEVPSARSL